jgi:TolB protein
VKVGVSLCAALVALVPTAASGTSPLIAFQSSASGAFDIWTVHLDGTGARDLTHSAAYDADPAWSPDGRRVVFARYNGPRGQLWVMNADGSGLERLTRDSTSDVEPAWSSNGKSIAFVRSPDGRRNYRIWVMRSNGTHPRLLSRNTFDSHPCWSPDSRRLVFVSARAGHPSVYVMNADGSGQRLLTGEVGVDDEDPAWSPNGRLIAWMHSAQLWLMNADGSKAHPLTPSTVSGVYDERPHWSPDSAHIVFATERFTEKSGLAVIGADGSGLAPIAAPANSTAPAWRP